MQNLLQLLQDLNVPQSEPEIIIVPIDNQKSNKDLAYQLELKIDD
ncbi:hypothetical protein GCM10008986_24760 [Salinibacillus aidingensis]|uniref:Uncharacterized protein n=1 Tax=Salinibacillus aidingensis TaxID=237684 RepID=A0ABP3LCQ5_9BACI